MSGVHVRSSGIQGGPGCLLYSSVQPSRRPACVEIYKRVNRRVRALSPSVDLQGDRGSLKMSRFPAAGLSEEQIQRFQREGFLVLENFASPEEVQSLRSRAEKLVDEFNPESVSVFSTKSQTKKTDQYFLDSANKVSFFIEEDAFAEDGSLRQAKALSINKIGHALHDLDPDFRSFSRSEKVAAILHSLDIKRPLPVQSMYIFKQPKIGGEVRPHQDSTFLRTSPPSVVGLWWALEDSTKQNGCLWALPGAHRQGVARHFIRREDDSVTFDKDLPEYNTEDFVPLEVPSGTLILLHGANVHFSYSNTSPHSRHAYSMHVIEGAPGTDYLKNNWLQRRPDFPFEPLTMPQAA